MGTAQNIKIYKRHGYGEKLFGVSFANLSKLKKKIKTDHALAEQLWETDNTDAMILATMIADPDQFDDNKLEEWVNVGATYVLVDYFVSNIAAKTSLARQKMEEWTSSDDEWIGRAGWRLLGSLAETDPILDDGYFEGFLEIIEKSIHSAKNRAREAMNMAVINIGVRNESLKEKAIETARAIGVVEIDHGDTSCKTPDAESYIEKTVEHRRMKAEKAAAKKKKTAKNTATNVPQHP